MNATVIAALARHLLTFGGGFLIQKGYLDNANLDILVGALISIGGVIWSIIQKKKNAK